MINQIDKNTLIQEVAQSSYFVTLLHLSNKLSQNPYLLIFVLIEIEPILFAFLYL